MRTARCWAMYIRRAVAIGRRRVAGLQRLDAFLLERRVVTLESPSASVPLPTDVGCRPRYGREKRSVVLDERKNETVSAVAELSLHVSRGGQGHCAQGHREVPTVGESRSTGGGDVRTCPFAVGASILGSLATRPQYTSAGSACTGDVTSACLHLVGTAGTFGKFSSSTILWYASASIGIVGDVLNCSIRYVCSPVTSLQEMF